MMVKVTYWIGVILLLGILINASVLVGQTLMHDTGAIEDRDTWRVDAEMPRLAGWNLKGMTWQLMPQSWETEAVIAKMRGHGQNYDRRDMQWFNNLLAILTRDGYDMIAEAYQPNHDFPQLMGDWGTTDWYTLNTQGNVFVEAVPRDIQYYEHAQGDAPDVYGQYGNINRLLEVTSLLARAKNTQSSLSTTS